MRHYPDTIDAVDYRALIEAEELTRQSRRRERGDYKSNGNTYEADWSQTVYMAARWRGWFAYRVLKSQGSTAGFPDLALFRPPRMVYAELKDETEPPTLEQVACMAMLKMYPGVEVYLWRPQDWEEIERILQ